MSRRRSRGRESQLAFEALTIEGGLLSPDWLARVAQLQAGQQSETDYRVLKGLNLRDEIGRYWRVAQALWRDFDAGLSREASPDALARTFATAFLRDVFGFASLSETPALVRDGRTFPLGWIALGGKVPVVIAPANTGLDTLAPRFGDEGKRRSAFGLVQEFLNATDEALWGIATDGTTLRILRDNASLTRPAWIEADLARIFREERYADFAALWLLVHESRFGTASSTPSDCPLESSRTAGREEGTRAREHLRRGVELALKDFGQGFLAHPENGALRTVLEKGELSLDAYFQQLLRLCYRLIFLLTAEERDVLHPPSADAAAKGRYAAGYSLRRLRERSARRSAHDRFGDLWEGLRIVLRGLARGAPKLALPALGGLFAEAQCPHLDAAKIENRFLLAGVFHLSWLREETGLARVNWRDMGPEELGSVYESLLELVPQRSNGGRTFGFATGDETRGNARKTSGSYYTPDSLVQVLLDSALDPVIKDTIAAHPENPVEALLSLSIVDPACGSGHFLLAAARRLAAQVARLEANGTPSAAQYRHALRQVVARCIYGVDLNPMALELCRVSLWMEAVEPGLPLSFLDSHLQHGNSLLGATPELLAKGIPDAAWEPIEGDDKKVASALKKRNKQSGQGQGTLASLWSASPADDGTEVTRAVEALDRAAEDDLDAVIGKARTWEEIRASAAYQHQKFVADAWCAAFVWPKVAGPDAEAAPTNDLWHQIRDQKGTVPARTRANVEALTAQYRFFHWHLAFPQVFKRGGFDVVLGNPPWEHVEVKEEEWFAQRLPDVAAAPNASVRKRMISSLKGTNPQLYESFTRASRAVDGEGHVARESGRFPLCARGRLNTYALFAEHNRAVLNGRGRAGFIVPTGIAVDDATKDFFASAIASKALVSLFDFENSKPVFPGVHRSFKFCALTLSSAGIEAPAALAFYLRDPSEAADMGRRFTMTAEDFRLLNPNTGNCPTFRSPRDAKINVGLYRRSGVLLREGSDEGNPWGLRFMQGVFNTASDSGLFRTQSELNSSGSSSVGNGDLELCGERLVPLVEAKMIHQFDHRYASYNSSSESSAIVGAQSEFGDGERQDPTRVVAPRYWVPESEVLARVESKWKREWFLGWRDICRSTDQRTAIASVVRRSGVGDTFLLALPAVEPAAVACLYASICSFALDYAARQKVGGTHLKYNVFKQLPILSPDRYALVAPWCTQQSLRGWIVPRVVELTYTAWDLEAFAKDVGYDGPPFRWDLARRALLRAELDAAFFLLYGIARDDVDYIMETFPIVKKNDEKAHGEYRTKRLILEIYDELAVAARTGRPYVSRLEPPPADPRVAHAESTRPAWAKKGSS